MTSAWCCATNGFGVSLGGGRCFVFTPSILTARRYSVRLRLLTLGRAATNDGHSPCLQASRGLLSVIGCGSAALGLSVSICGFDPGNRRFGRVAKRIGTSIRCVKSSLFLRANRTLRIVTGPRFISRSSLQWRQNIIGPFSPRCRRSSVRISVSRTQSVEFELPAAILFNSQNASAQACRAKGVRHGTEAPNRRCLESVC